MSGEAQLLLWIAGVHLLGLICVAMLIVPALREPPEPPASSDPGSSDDGWGNQRPTRPTPSNIPGGGLPLPDAEQSRVRLREPGRLSELLPRPERRPAREPARRPVRADRP